MHITEKALTFDDVLLVPAFSSILPQEASLVTKLTPEISLNIPILSAAMDTVTESHLAIALAQEGGIGFIHKNMSPEAQAKLVRLVKKHESGVIREPLTVAPDTSIQEALKLTKKYHISGLPVIEGKTLVGIITRRDLRFETCMEEPVSKIMTQKEQLVTVREGTSKEEIKTLLHKHRIEKVLVVDENFQLQGMVTVKDMQKIHEFPNACKDADERLRVGAAVGVGKPAQERVEALIEAEADIVLVDTAHGHSLKVIEMVSWVKSQFPDCQLIAGNVATGEGAKALIEAGANGIKVGIGPGSICTTRIVSGVGMPQISAIANVAKAIQGSDIPCIADGGIRFAGDMAKALAAGAHSVMIGGMFAGTEEAPGEVEFYKGRSYKSYRGMGSLGAMSQQYSSSDRYFQESEEIAKLIPEGIEGRVPCKGPLDTIIRQLLGGVRAAMGYTGCKDLEALRTKTTFIKVTSAGMQESHVHDVTITKEAPNYRVE